MTVWRPSAALAGLATVLAAAPAAAAPSVPPRLESVAERSVVAVEQDGERRTGFRLGDVIVVPDGGDEASVTTARGATAEADAVASRDGVATFDAEGLELRPLVAGRRPRREQDAFVLGPPVGYEQAKLRPVRLVVRGRRWSLRGSLPGAFAGAPVVNGNGRLLGAVGSRGRERATVIPAATLSDVASETDDGGVPLVPAVAGLLGLLALALTAILVLRARRRRRAGDEEHDAADPAEPAEPAVTAPLVRRRETAFDEVPDDDFEVVMRSSGEEPR